MKQVTNIEQLALLLGMVHPNRHDLMGWAGAQETDWFMYSDGDQSNCWWLAQDEDDSLFYMVHYQEDAEDSGGFSMISRTLLP